MPDEKVAQNHLVVIQSFRIYPLYILGGSGKCEVLQEYPLDLSVDTLIQVVVLHHSVLSPVLVLAIRGGVSDPEVNVPAHIAVKPSSQIVSVGVYWSEIFIDHAWHLLEGQASADVEVASDEA